MAGVRRLRSLGYGVLLGEHVLARDGYLAGADEDRAGDLNRMLRDPLVRAIWFARGGYGSARLLTRIDWRALARGGKTLIGYSDLTALFAAAGRRASTICLYGPGVSELGDRDAYHWPSLRSLLQGRAVTQRFRARQVLRHGRVSGRLVGGNLTVLAHLLGTRYAPDFRDAVLFLEDVGEPVYRLDRALMHLKLAGVLDRVSAVLIGSLEPKGRGRAFPPDRPVEELVEEFFAPLGVPVVTGLPSGHLQGKRSLPLGGLARVDTRAGRLEAGPFPVRATSR
jgi:muramoyltetrapeptide carboxypeptidase